MTECAHPGPSGSPVRRAGALSSLVATAVVALLLLPAAARPPDSAVSRPAAAGSPAPADAPAPLTLGPLPESCDGLDVAWRHDAAGHPADAVAADLTGDGRDELVVSGTEGLRALRPGVPTDRATLWHLPFQARWRSIVVAELDGEPEVELVAGSAQSGHDRSGVVAVDGRDGAVRWHRRVPGGAVVLRAGDVDGDGRDEVVVAGGGHALHLLSAVDGADRWAPLPLGGPVTDLRLGDLSGDGALDAVVTLDGGAAVAVGLGGRTPLWRHEVAGGALKAAAVGDVTGDGAPEVVLAGRGIAGSLTPGRGDRVIAPGSSRGGLVVAVDGAGGGRLWDYGQAGNLTFGAVALGDVTGDGVADVVAHASRLGAGHLLALAGPGAHLAGVPTGEPQPLWTFDTTRGPASAQGAYGPDGLVVADANGDGLADALLASWSGAVLAVDGRAPRRAATLLDAARRAGGLLDVPQATGLWEAVRDAPRRHGSLIDGGRFALALGADNLVALHDGDSGTLAWRFDAGGWPALAAASGAPGDAGAGRLHGIGTSAGRVYGLGADGALLGAADAFLRERVVAVAATDVTGDGRDELVAAALDGEVAAVDPASGGRLWTADLAGRPTALAVGADVVAVGSAAGDVVGLGATDGALRWVVPGGPAVQALAFSSDVGRFAVGDAAGRLRLLEADGVVRVEADTASAGRGGVADVAAAVTPGGDGFAVAAGWSLQAFSSDGARRWRHDAAQQVPRVAAGDLDGDGIDEVVGAALDGRLHAVDGRSGRPRWIRHAGTPGDVAVADLDGSGRGEAVLATPVDAAGERGLLTLDADGDVVAACRLRKTPHRLAATPLAAGSDGLVVTMEQGDVYAFARR